MIIQRNPPLLLDRLKKSAPDTPEPSYIHFVRVSKSSRCCLSPRGPPKEARFHDCIRMRPRDCIAFHKHAWNIFIFDPCSGLTCPSISYLLLERACKQKTQLAANLGDKDNCFLIQLRCLHCFRKRQHAAGYSMLQPASSRQQATGGKTESNRKQAEGRIQEAEGSKQLAARKQAASNRKQKTGCWHQGRNSRQQAGRNRKQAAGEGRRQPAASSSQHETGGRQQAGGNRQPDNSSRNPSHAVG